jgi:hypothetical protein
LGAVAEHLASYDWRTSATPGLSDDERLRKAAFRGSGGYKELRRQLLLHLEQAKGEVGQAATDLLKLLKYN